MQISICLWFKSYDEALAALFHEGMPRYDENNNTHDGWHYVHTATTMFAGSITKGTGASNDLWLMSFALIEKQPLC